MEISDSPLEEKSKQWPQIAAILIVCLEAITCGMFFSWTSPSIPILMSDDSPMKLTFEEASYLAVIPSISLMLASPFFAYLADKIGRKNSVIFMTIPQLIAWLLIAFATNPFMLYVSRFISGCVDGGTYTALPMYIAEITEPSVRGSWGNVFTLSVFLGLLLINILGSYISIRTTALICCSLPIVNMILLPLIPKSPYFLIMKGRKEEARKALQRLRWMENVDKELEILTSDVQRQMSESGTVKDCFAIPVNRKSLFIMLGTFGFQQLSGLSAFILYSQYIFLHAGGQISENTSAILVHLTLLICSGFASYFIEKFGRRPLMIYSSLGCAIVLTIEAIYFYLHLKSNWIVAQFHWIPLAGMIVYICISSMGVSTVPTLMLGEVFSASIKSKAMCILNIAFGVYMMFSSKIFQVLSDSVGMYAAFILFAAGSYGGVVFSYFFVPETKGKTLEEIQQMLRQSGKSNKVDCIKE